MSAKAKKEPAIRDRITELRRVKASDLLPHPGNWRTHPKAQSEALSAILREVGYADALLARETPDGLQLIDGHLRRVSNRSTRTMLYRSRPFTLTTLPTERLR